MANENSPEQVNEAIRLMCQTSLGVLDKGFLCQSLSVLAPKEAFSVREDETMESVLGVLREKKIGCVAVVKADGTISGIFSERDFVLKVALDYTSLKTEPVSRFMTKDPITQELDSTIAFALNLMSTGGFRHIPIVDRQNVPRFMLSVKDVVDYIVETFTTDLMNFPTE